MKLCFFLAFFIAFPALAQKPLEARSQCAESPAIIFSHKFTLCLPPSLLRRAAIARADDLLIKFHDGSYVYGKVITAEMDGLPTTFDMRLYPEYLFGIRRLAELPPEQAVKFKQASEILRSRNRDPALSRFTTNGLTTYLLYGKESSEGFVISNDTDQVLLVGFSRINLNDAQQILKGIK